MNESPVVDRHAVALAAAFERWLGPITLGAVRTRSWASATFVGTRLTMTFAIPIEANVALFLAEVQEADLPLRRAFVADIVVAEPEQVDASSARLIVEVLVIDDA